jgi:pyruvate carboxylase
VTGAFKNGGKKAVRRLLNVLDTVVNTPEESLSDEIKRERLNIYKNCNDAFRNLLLGKFGRLPLGFPDRWVYESAFGEDFERALMERTENSPLTTLPDLDVEAERRALTEHLERDPSDEELVLYLNHPGDALNTFDFVRKFGDANLLPLDVWFEGLDTGRELYFRDSQGKHHLLTILAVSEPDARGNSVVRYTLDSEFFSHQVKVAEATGVEEDAFERADKDNPYHVGSPSNGDLWVMQVQPGDIVKPGEELFNISIMKQEKAVFSRVEGMVKRVLKVASYQEDRKMVPVHEGELLVELMPIPRQCPTCKHPAVREEDKFCSFCGQKL